MIRHSGSTSKNERVKDWTDEYQDKDNLEFFAAALEELTSKDAGNGGLMAIGLLGQRDIPGITLRLAQSVLRWDLRPSLWSHAFLIAARTSDVKEIGDLPIREVSIYSRTGTFPEPANNAVTEAMLADYASAKVDANVGLLSIAMSKEEADNVAKRATKDPNLDRLRYDFWETLGIWASYLWSSGTRPNPLREGFPMFSSAFVEYCFEAIPLDLSPAASERNSAPEHIWNSAVWWDDAFTEFGHPISGYYCLRDKSGSLLDPQ
jgi:hypothetical protein